MSKPVPLLSIIVPCYNEEETLSELYRRLSEICAPYAGSGYEILLIDDGSKDGTWNVIRSLHATDARVNGVCFSRNFGHGMALTAGLELCRGERVLIIDADLQDPPELLPAMMRKMDEGADVVYGKRVSRAGETWFKRVSARFFYRLLNRISDVPMPEDTGDFRLMDRKVVQALKAMPETARYIRGMVAWVGFKQVPIEYERSARFAGATHYTLEKMLRLALDAITGFSNRPLRLAFYLGVLMLILSILLLIYVVGSYFLHDTVRGWASLICILVGTQAIQWLLIGLIGEYIGRIYQESKHRPNYIILDTAGTDLTFPSQS